MEFVRKNKKLWRIRVEAGKKWQLRGKYRQMFISFVMAAQTF